MMVLTCTRAQGVFSIHAGKHARTRIQMKAHEHTYMRINIHAYIHTYNHSYMFDHVNIDACINT
jgi:hypothetical protein